ncbi:MULTISPECIES: cardiolipin synthase [Exiguobacterium]|uniref:cardiolipin synthase n=1 Tax=Exiguobacterium TaxID=33986 RepID=UPI001BE83FD3|nr:cardiolipin synthase [Exiguobacterium himgiriensis]MCT4783338.1 cardiolipin synthase [Exiguobacterium himgiriensis]
MITTEVVLSTLGVLILIVNMMFAITIIFFERRDIGSTWAWLLVLLFLPLVGFFIYIFFGRLIKSNNFYQVAEERRHEYAQHVQAQLDELDGHHGLFTSHPILSKYRRLARLNLCATNALVTSHNQIRVFHDGEQKFEALFHDIENALTEINIQYYIIQNDSLGQALIAALTERAKQGVRVRLLYDAVGSRGLRRKHFKALLQYGGEVKSFFPSRLGINFRVNNRNHRKLCIIDGEIGYIGGFNVGNEYLGANRQFGYWRDVHLRMRGEAVRELSERFLLDWNRAEPTKRTTEKDELMWPAVMHETFTAPVQVVTSGPNSTTEHLKNMLVKMITEAKEAIYIQTPYFIPDASFLDACRIALMSGTKVHLMIPNKPDHMFVYWATYANAAELVRYGADVYTYEGGFLHAKTLVIDGEVASIGTTNIDARSFHLNFEISALVFDETVAQSVIDAFERDVPNATCLTVERYETRTRWIRFKESVSRLLSPIL